MAHHDFLPNSPAAVEVYRVLGPSIAHIPNEILARRLLDTLNTPDDVVLRDQLSTIDNYIDAESAQQLAPSWFNVEGFKTEMAKFNSAPFVQGLLEASPRYQLGEEHKLPAPAGFNEAEAGYSWERIMQAAHSAVGISTGNVHFFGWSIAAVGFATIYGDKFPGIVRDKCNDNPITLAAADIAAAHPERPQNATEAAVKLHAAFTGNIADKLQTHEAFYHEVEDGIRRCPMRGKPTQRLFEVIGTVMTIPEYQGEFTRNITKS